MFKNPPKVKKTQAEIDFAVYIECYIYDRHFAAC